MASSSPSRYPVPAGEHRVEEVIRRSRFITAGGRAPDPDAAHAFVARIREEFPDATHHCWAFVAGPPGDTSHIGMSDDGEPAGTAGRPMLTALLHGGVGEIVAVSTRYFGGVKLGTGGLSRAYSGGVNLLLEGLPVTDRVEWVRFEVVVDYASVDPLQRLLESLEGRIDEQAYGEVVRYGVSVPSDRAGSLAEDVAGITQGRGSVRPLPTD